MSQTSTSTALASGKQQAINAVMAEVSQIATLPEITVKIIETVEDPDASAEDLHKIIANDPALCARVLKVVNSAFYGLPGQIGSINRAIVLLGLNAVKNIAIAASLAKLFRGGRLCADFSAKDLWTHSIGVAAGVKLLVERLKVNVLDEAFLSGLMHDIGVMVEMQAVQPKLLEVFDVMREEKLSMLDAEEKVIGANHQDFGKALCEKWKFPASFACVAGFHHNPMTLTSEQRSLTAMVHVADVLAARLKLGCDKTVSTLEIEPEVTDYLKLTDKMIEQVTEDLPRAHEVAGDVMSLS
ncbi:MAG: HDOD domain-containing protein [Planctomycetes bacterium]|nr:HDOD domain-containing protein [Planctomycetota bacterium]